MNYSASNKKPLRILSPIHKATRQVHDHFRGQATGVRLSNIEAHLLSYLLSYGPVSVATVVQVLDLKKSTLTGMADRLVEQGLITRMVNPDDRRSFLVELTPAGRQRAEGVRASLERFESEVLSRVSPDDVTGFENVMNAIAAATADAGQEEDPC